MADVEQVRQIEEVAANAWPARIVQHLDGWLLRANDGVTGRANSVLPLEDGGRVPLSERLAAVEEFYARRGLPALFQMTHASRPAGLDRALAERGYRMGMRTAIQTAPLDSLLGVTSPDLVMEDRFSEEWFRLYCRAEELAPERALVRAEVYPQIGPRTAYALLRLDGEPAAVGLGVLERGWLGLFSLATLPKYRRRGAATAVIRALSVWGARQGAAGAYLQVGESNDPALALYARLGFRTLYHYHYRRLG